MLTRVFWITKPNPAALGIMPRPSGGELLDGEMLALREAGVDTVVSLLTDREQRELDLTSERELCEKHQMQFVSFPIEDRQVPRDPTAFLRLAQSLSDSLREGRNVVIHCRIGVGRAALVAAGVLVAQGGTVDDAFARIAAARGCPVPDTEDQRRWLQDLACLLRA